MENPNLNMDDLGVPPFQETSMWKPPEALARPSLRRRISFRSLSENWLENQTWLENPFLKPLKNDDFMCLTYEKLWFHGNFMGFGWEIAWLNGGWKNFRRFKHAKIVRKNGGLSSLNHVIEQKKQYTVYSTLRNPGCIIIESLASKPVYSISYEPNQLFCW